MTYHEYSNPKGTGWKGWLENPNGQAVDFVSLDGRVIFDW